jgi:hypothetical protein
MQGKAEEVYVEDFDGLFFRGYDDDGYFVRVPAGLGDGIGLVVGAVPAALTAGAFHLFYAPEYQVRQAGGTAMRCFTYPCGFLVGLPFKVLKVVFWDAPASIFGSTEPDSPATPPSQVTDPENPDK